MPVTPSISQHLQCWKEKNQHSAPKQFSQRNLPICHNAKSSDAQSSHGIPGQQALRTWNKVVTNGLSEAAGRSGGRVTNREGG